METFVLSFWLLTLHYEHRLDKVELTWHINSLKINVMLFIKWFLIYNLLKVIVYSSIDIVNKGRPCLEINRNNTWFLVMCGLHYTCIHVEYNYSLHDLGVKLPFSWCLIMLITTIKMEYDKIQKYFPFLAYTILFGGEFVLWFWWNSLSKGERFPTHIHTTFYTIFFCVLGMCVKQIFSGSFVDLFFHFFFSKLWKSES